MKLEIHGYSLAVSNATDTMCCSWKASNEHKQRKNSTKSFVHEATNGMVYNVGKRHRYVLSEPALERVSVILMNK